MYILTRQQEKEFANERIWAIKDAQNRIRELQEEIEELEEEIFEMQKELDANGYFYGI